MILDRSTKAMEKGQFFFKMVLGKLDIHRQKNEVEPYLRPYIEITTEWIKDL